jgi:quinol monooxygenase YgiN
MLTVIAKLKVKADRTAAFEEEARKMIAHVAANEPGTRTYRCHRSTADPTVYVFYEVYDDQAAFAAHGGSPAMQAFFGAMRGIVDGRPEIEMYEAIGGTGA